MNDSMKKSWFTYQSVSIPFPALYVFIILFFGSVFTPLSAQQTVHGKVTEKDHTVPLAGVRVSIKGTETSTVTAMDGTFSIQVSGNGEVLIFQSVGFITREYQLKGASPIQIVLKPSCNIDYFDDRLISLGLQAGILNTPLGGSLRISLPYMHVPGIFWSGIQYQKGPDAYMTRLETGYDHMVSECYFRLDLKAGYTKVSYKNDVNAIISTVGGTAHFSRLLPGIRYFSVHAGAGHLSFYERNASRWRPYLGPSFGLGTALFRKIQLYVSTQVLLARHHPEFQLRLNKSLRQFSFFSNYYQLNGLKEITVGAGWSFYYRGKNKGHN